MDGKKPTNNKFPFHLFAIFWTLVNAGRDGECKYLRFVGALVVMFSGDVQW
jgi:hypothetical protein